jgi:hypothetical protein
MRDLAREPDGQPIAGRLGDHRPSLKRGGAVPLLVELQLDHLVRLLKGALKVAADGLKVVEEVVWDLLVYCGCSICHRLLDLKQRKEGVVADLDQRDRVLGGVTTVRDDQDDRLANHPNLARRQNGRVALPVAGGRVECAYRAHSRLEVGDGQDRGHPGELKGLGGIDPGEASVGLGASDEGSVMHPRQRDVVDVGAAPRQQPAVLTTRNPGPDRAGHLRVEHAAALAHRGGQSTIVINHCLSYDLCQVARGFAPTLARRP